MDDTESIYCVLFNVVAIELEVCLLLLGCHGVYCCLLFLGESLRKKKWCMHRLSQ